MNIITNKGTVDTAKEAVVFVFKSDDELNLFMTRLANTEVKTSGGRVVSLIPPNVNLTPLQSAVLNIIDSLDGFGCKDDSKHEKIIDNAVDGINNVLNNF